jgi:hypothetical protein
MSGSIEECMRHPMQGQYFLSQAICLTDPRPYPVEGLDRVQKTPCIETVLEMF